MNKLTLSKYADIDWLQLWRNERKNKSWKSKDSTEWDKKADAFSERTLHSPYVPLLLSRLPISAKTTVLDIGCGPGTLALPLAEHVARVTAIDYSKNMLSILNNIADQRNLSNIETFHCSWEDDWEARGIPTADIGIASRSMNVDNLPTALRKIDKFSSQYVFLTDRIAPSPFDPDAFRAIGRDFNSGPDYIFTINMLYSMNIHPNVEILQLDKETRFNSFEEAFASYVWMFKKLTTEEEQRLEKYLRSISTIAPDGNVSLFRKNPPSWAMIWWKKG